MDGLVDPTALVDSTQIAARLDVRLSRLYMWQQSPRLGFPAHVAEVGTKYRSKLWVWEEVEAWAQQTGRLQPDGQIPETRPVEDYVLHDDVMTARDIGKLRGWHRTTAVTLWRSGSFPEPKGKIGRAWVWDAETVFRWHEENR